MEIKKLLEKVVKAKLNTEEILTAKLLTEIEVELEEESNLVEAPVNIEENFFPTTKVVGLKNRVSQRLQKLEKK